MKRNNKGFSLVELLVSFAILGVVSVIIGIIMTSGSHMFSSNKKILSLQYKSQVASAQLHNHLQNCNAGIAEDEDNLWVAHKEDENHGTIYLFTLDEDEDTINLRTFNVAITVEDGAKTVDVTCDGVADSVSSVTADVIAECVAQPFCSDVTSWHISKGPNDRDENGELKIKNAEYATIELNFERDGSTYTRKTVESFRNRPLNIDISGLAENDKTDAVIKAIFGLE